MAKMDINYRVLIETADSIDEYCDMQHDKMRAMDDAVKSLISEGWIGDDATAFMQQWEAIDDDFSTAVKFQKALTEYGKTLRDCAEAYKSTHRDVYNAACRLW